MKEDGREEQEGSFPGKAEGLGELGRGPWGALSQVGGQLSGRARVQQVHGVVPGVGRRPLKTHSRLECVFTPLPV